jgi:hypothetical protein
MLHSSATLSDEKQREVLPAGPRGAKVAASAGID